MAQSNTVDVIFFPFSLSSPPGFEIFKEPISILFRGVKNDRPSDISFYLEDDDGNRTDFNVETLTFTVMLTKNERLSYSIQQTMTDSKTTPFV